MSAMPAESTTRTFCAAVVVIRPATAMPSVRRKPGRSISRSASHTSEQKGLMIGVRSILTGGHFLRFPTTSFPSCKIPVGNGCWVHNVTVLRLPGRV